jgi:hypothetical protein
MPYKVDFNGTDLIEGVYFVRLTQADGTILIKKMVFLKY